MFLVSWPVLSVTIFSVLIGCIAGCLLWVHKVRRFKHDIAGLHTKHRKLLLAAELDAQEGERRRIAADLHDHIISKLTLLRLNNTNSPDLNAALGDIIEEARHLCHGLMPPLYEEMEVEEVLMSIVTQWKSHYSLAYRTDIRATSLDNRLKLQIARIFQELLTNIHKHAQAKAIAVDLRITDARIAMVVNDDGVGFDGKRRGAGIGLCNLQLRVESVGGIYKIKKSADGGTRFIFSMSSYPSSNLVGVEEPGEMQY